MISQGAMFGYTVFSQPSTWKFEWAASSSSRSGGGGAGVTMATEEIVVFPAFVKVGDEKGQRLKSPVVMCAMETMTLGSTGT